MFTVILNCKISTALAGKIKFAHTKKLPSEIRRKLFVAEKEGLEPSRRF